MACPKSQAGLGVVDPGLAHAIPGAFSSPAFGAQKGFDGGPHLVWQPPLVLGVDVSP